MKSFRLGMLVLLFIGVSAYSYSQNAQATISHDGSLKLDANQPLTEAYQVDANQFNFYNLEEALAYFKEVNTDLVIYRPVLHNDLIMVYLQLKKQPSWTIEDWNAYLEEHKTLETAVQHDTAK